MTDVSFQGWEEFDEGRGGTTVCTRCGITAVLACHAVRAMSELEVLEVKP